MLHDIASPLDPQTSRKRRKQDNEEETERIENCVLDITALIESRDWQAIPGDAALVAALMEVLSNVLARRQDIPEGIDYLEQELLAGILAVLTKIQVSTVALGPFSHADRSGEERHSALTRRHRSHHQGHSRIDKPSDITASTSGRIGAGSIDTGGGLA